MPYTPKIEHLLFMIDNEVGGESGDVSSKLTRLIGKASKVSGSCASP
jgi:hypothetical protein